MKLDDILSVLHAIAPHHLAAPWDEVGLHVAGSGKSIKRAMLCIDLTPAVLSEAIAEKCQLIVAYHPPIFRPLARLANRDWKEKMIARCIRAGIAVYSPHTSLDAVRGGMNDWLCNGLGEHSVRFSIAREVREHNPNYKISVYVPPADSEKLRRAMWASGAGTIGEYGNCSYTSKGMGTFRGTVNTNPTIGSPGHLERVEEDRIEMICEQSALGDVLKSTRLHHPYEEAAIDVIELSPEPQSRGMEQAPGRCHILKTTVSASTLVRRTKKVLGLKKLKVAIPQSGKVDIGSIAVCVGSGGSVFESFGDADAYITGEMQHHQILDMVERGKVVILAGHTNTERPFLHNYRQTIIEKSTPGVDWIQSEKDRSPVEIV